MGFGQERLKIMSASRCLLLDMGKVFVSFDFRRFGDRMRALTGLGTEQLRATIMGDDFAHRYEVGLIDDAEFHKEFCWRVGTDIPWEEFVSAWNSIFAQEPLLPESLILTLAQRSRLWIVSNTNKIHFDFLIRCFSSLRHFTGFILSHEVGLAKPDPAIFRLALSKAGVEAGEALFVDDQTVNVEAARSLGIDAFQFLNPDQFVQELRARRII